jgi:hypothetical protein
LAQVFLSQWVREGHLKDQFCLVAQFYFSGNQNWRKYWNIAKKCPTSRNANGRKIFLGIYAMDSFLQNILGIKTPLFSSGMTKLEKATGHSAIDVRLIVDINSRKTQILCELGLDPRDTTGREMYAALMSAVKTS